MARYAVVAGRQGGDQFASLDALAVARMQCLDKTVGVGADLLCSGNQTTPSVGAVRQAANRTGLPTLRRPHRLPYHRHPPWYAWRCHQQEADLVRSGQRVQLRLADGSASVRTGHIMARYAYPAPRWATYGQTDASPPTAA
jgi:hypothetical protein